MSNDYIFFDPALRDRFLALVGARGLAASTRPDAMGGHVVALPDELDAAIEADLEAAYDELMAAERELADASEAVGVHRVMGVNIVRPDGGTQVVRVPGTYALGLMEQFTLDEIRELVTAIAAEVLAPHGGPLCRR